MKKIFYLLLFILMIVIPLNIKAGSSNFSNLTSFIKEDEEGNFINDAEFRIRSLNGSIVYPVYKTKELGDLHQTPRPMSVKKLAVGDILNNGEYEFYYRDVEDYDKLINILGPEEKQILENLKDYSKHEEYFEMFDQDFVSNYAYYQTTRGIKLEFTDNCPTHYQEQSAMDMNEKKYNVINTAISISDECEYLIIKIPVLMLLEETKAPVGLKKEKAILKYYYTIVYNFDKDNNFLGVGKANTNGTTYELYGIYKYNYDLDYSNILGLEMKKLTLVNEDELYYKDTCGGTFYDKEYGGPGGTQTPKIMAQTDNSCYDHKLLIIDYKDGAKLVVTSYVNNGGSTKAVKGSEVYYKVEVKNEGTGESTNNVITSKIPDGFKYVSGSASDNGEYIESLNAVRWNIDVIEGETTKDLTYKVTVSEDVDLSKTYISSATVTNDGSDEIVSNETRVTLQGDIINPKTGDLNKIIILFTLSVIGLIVYYVLDKKLIRL